MPNTLAEPWTWNSIPEWERSILQGLEKELTAHSNIKTAIRIPNQVWESKYWYGIEVWSLSMGYEWAVLFLYADRLKVTIMLNSSVTYAGQRVFDLTEPNSVETIVSEALRHLTGRNAPGSY